MRITALTSIMAGHNQGREMILEHIQVLMKDYPMIAMTGCHQPHNNLDTLVVASLTNRKDQ